MSIYILTVLATILIVLGVILFLPISLTKSLFGVKSEARLTTYKTVGYSSNVPFHDVVKMRFEFQKGNGRWVSANIKQGLDAYEIAHLQPGITLTIYYHKMNSRNICFAKGIVPELNEKETRALEKEIPQREIDVNRLITKELLFMAETGKRATGTILNCERNGQQRNEMVGLKLQIKILNQSDKESVTEVEKFVEEKFISYLKSGAILEVYYFDYDIDHIALAVPIAH